MHLEAGFVDSLFRLDDRVAVVTGGGSGLGAAMAVGLAQAGAELVIVDLNEAGAEEVAAEIREQHGGKAEARVADVTDTAALRELATSIGADHGHVDVLVNSAGTAFRCPIEEYPEDRFDAIIALNLKATYMSCQAFGREMLAGSGGSIINIASIGGSVVYPHSSAYTTSKGGVMQATRAFALEWIGKVRVNGIAPTLIETPLVKANLEESSVTADFIKARMLREELGKPHDLVGAAIFLASDASALVTGHVIPVDDGYLIA